ncbi:PKD domain-containing protein [Vogesella indigofera]|uniref:PKD domain-containing protein n=1 Tax=Vogesella indigofera TaxID=45465 RepID=UPI003570B0E3
MADAGNDGTIKEGARKHLDGSLSYDPDAGDAITNYHWVQTAGTAVTLEQNASLVNPSFLAPVGNPGEMLTFALAVSDGKETSTADSVNVSVVANSAPVANAGSDDSRNENTLVSLNGGASSDPDGDGISYGWAQLTGPLVSLNNATTATPSFTTPWVGPGGVPLTFKLTVNDDDPVNPKSHSDTVVINVLNINDPPNCSLAQPSVSVLWPPNHGLVAVMINNVADPNGNSTLTISSVTQDEPINGLGDGDTTPDAIVQHGNTADSVLLRAERSGKADGRVYRVNFTATDAEGSCSGFVTVSTPHDRNKTAIDNGQTTTSTQP